jgi:hypothetical protein
LRADRACGAEVADPAARHRHDRVRLVAHRRLQAVLEGVARVGQHGPADRGRRYGGRRRGGLRRAGHPPLSHGSPSRSHRSRHLRTAATTPAASRSGARRPR